MKGIAVEVFDQVETLVTLFLVIPETPAKAEKSFGTFRRLKHDSEQQWHVILNSVAVCLFTRTN